VKLVDSREQPFGVDVGFMPIKAWLMHICLFMAQHSPLEPEAPGGSTWWLS
jgi:hypothetical protein